MNNCEDIDRIDIPDELFKNDFIINRNLAELKYYIRLFFIGILLDDKLGKDLGHHFFNELIPIDYDNGYDNRFIKVPMLCSYNINELEILLMYNSKKRALNKFISKNRDLKNIKNELKIFIDMMYLIDNSKNKSEQ